MLHPLWSTLSHIKKAQFTPTAVQLKIFGTVTEKFLVLVKFDNLWLIIFNQGQRFGNKGSCNLWDKLWGGAGNPGQPDHSGVDPVVALKPKDKLVWGLLLGGR